MRKLALSLAALAFTTSAALAQTPITFAQVDIDGDGRVSLTELQAVWPDFTAEEFAAVDVEGVGSITAEQLAALQAGAGASAEVTGGMSMETTTGGGTGLSLGGAADAGATVDVETPTSLLDTSD